MGGLSAIVETGNAITDPLVKFANSAIDILPGLIGAILLATFGYLLAAFMGIIVHKILVKAGLDTWYESTGKHAVLGHMSLSKLLSGMTKWYLFALFLVPAVSAVQMNTFALLLSQIALWIPKLLVGIIIALAGIVVADIAAEKLSHAKKIGWIKGITPVIKFIIVLFFLDVALRQVGIDFTLASSTFLIVLSGITLAIAIAVGISLGSALKPEVEGMVKHFKKKMND